MTALPFLDEKTWWAATILLKTPRLLKLLNCRAWAPGVKHPLLLHLHGGTKTKKETIHRFFLSFSILDDFDGCCKGHEMTFRGGMFVNQGINKYLVSECMLHGAALSWSEAWRSCFQGQPRAAATRQHSHLGKCANWMPATRCM